MMNRNMMKQAQQLQKQMLKAQQEIEETKVEFSSGGGVIKVVVSGKMIVESIVIDPDAVDSDDVEMLQDLVLSAVNGAMEKAQELASSKMGAITGGLNIPGIT
jgi:DNA-binding YbaB/EbfC family protein